VHVQRVKSECSNLLTKHGTGGTPLGYDGQWLTEDQGGLRESGGPDAKGRTTAITGFF